MDKKDKLLTISELSSKLNFIHPNTKKPQNHILRYWEKEFKQIRPIRINKRRYYSSKQVELIKLIKFLIKNEGMSISGVKIAINKKINERENANSISLIANYHKLNLKNKTRKILDKIYKLKKYGKKNSH